MSLSISAVLLKIKKLTKTKSKMFPQVYCHYWVFLVLEGRK